jgi:thiol-disulfide isomerase/thioredoxin
MRFLIIFIFLISNTFASETNNIKNLVLHKKLIKYDSITFLNDKNKQLNLKKYEGNLILLNFWATWCAPCKEEMPSLDSLKKNKNLNNLEIFPINVGQENIQKTLKFFKDLKIKNLDLYFDPPVTLAKKFKLRGIPTTIIFNKKGEELARIIGSIDFEDENFLKWLSSYN